MELLLGSIKTNFRPFSNVFGNSHQLSWFVVFAHTLWSIAVKNSKYLPGMNPSNFVGFIVLIQFTKCFQCTGWGEKPVVPGGGKRKGVWLLTISCCLCGTVGMILCLCSVIPPTSLCLRYTWNMRFFLSVFCTQKLRILMWTAYIIIHTLSMPLWAICTTHETQQHHPQG